MVPATRSKRAASPVDAAATPSPSKRARSGSDSDHKPRIRSPPIASPPSSPSRPAQRAARPASPARAIKAESDEDERKPEVDAWAALTACPLCKGERTLGRSSTQENPGRRFWKCPKPECRADPGARAFSWDNVLQYRLSPEEPARLCTGDPNRRGKLCDEGQRVSYGISGMTATQPHTVYELCLECGLQPSGWLAYVGPVIPDPYCHCPRCPPEPVVKVEEPEAEVLKPVLAEAAEDEKPVLAETVELLSSPKLEEWQATPSNRQQLFS